VLGYNHHPNKTEEINSCSEAGEANDGELERPMMGRWGTRESKWSLGLGENEHWHLNWLEGLLKKLVLVGCDGSLIVEQVAHHYRGPWDKTF